MANYNQNSEFGIPVTGNSGQKCMDCSGIHFPSEFIVIPETGIGKRKLLPLGLVTGNWNVQLSCIDTVHHAAWCRIIVHVLAVVNALQ